ncbi:MAG: HAD family hydrolase [Phycisphaeraceae bacterium]|nr:HAD family hydrolase [Phycisphaeraceae bacterium]
MINCKHIIWDWNGTLINDSWVCVEILNTLLLQYGKETTTHETYLKEFGFPVAAYYEHLGFDFSVDPFDTIADEYIDRYSTRQYECDLYEGADTVLEALNRIQVPQSILSAYHQDYLTEAVTKFQVSHFFKHIKGREDHYATSKVEAGHDLIGRLGLHAEQTLLIGDTLHDLEVANALGTQCILISRGHQTADRLADADVLVVDDISQIPDQIQTPG